MRGASPPLATLMVLTLLTVVLSGCVQSDLDGEGAPGALRSLETYEFRYGLDDAFSGAAPFGWMVKLTNPTDDVVEFRYEMVHPNETAVTHGPATDDGWISSVTPDEAPKRVRLAAGESVAYLFQAELPQDSTNVTYALQVLDNDMHVVEQQTTRRDLVAIESPLPVAAGQHVQTAVVGVYSNGTSFYTNIADLFNDDAFPYWVPPAEDGPFDGTPLSVYVYDETREEQPPRSRDACYSSTVTGYNELLKTQVLGSTGVRWLAPEEAYTLPGYEDFFLYDHDLVFLNTIVAHDGGTAAADQVPDPTGACFDGERYVPEPPVPVS